MSYLPVQADPVVPHRLRVGPYLPLKPADAQAAPVVPLEVEVIGAEVYSR
jgi:hypothetical protein